MFQAVSASFKHELASYKIAADGMTGQGSLRSLHRSCPLLGGLIALEIEVSPVIYQPFRGLRGIQSRTFSTQEMRSLQVLHTVGNVTSRPTLDRSQQARLKDG